MASDDFLRPLQQRRDRLGELGSQLRFMQDRRQELERAVEDYKSYEPSVERGKLGKLVAKASELSREIANTEKRKAAYGIQLQEVRLEQINPMLFWKLFTAEQKQLRAEAARIRRKILVVDKHLESDKDTLTKTNTQAGMARESLAEHVKFDLESTAKLLSGFPESIKRTKADRAALTAELTHIETSIRPHVKKLELLNSEVSTLSADIAQAETFNRNLDAAPNGYERKMIHNECEDRFGTGRPTHVINDIRSKIRRLENNIPKVERRISEELQKSVRKIEHLLIDGNNICYEGQAFIELRAITALLTTLAGRYKITIVFDGSIRSLLKANTQDITRRLGTSVDTHIAPTKTAADEYLLKLAGSNKKAFILSNDRYAEYHDYDAVKSGRILRFLIADGKLMANDLDITVGFLR